MADNVTANAGSGGSTFAAPELSFSGDTVKLPLSSLGILSGSEGAWTFTLYTGGAGAVTAGTPRVTLASDDPAVASLSSIKTAVELIDNAISGTEMQVDVVGALPAGTNAIGKLAANSGVDIGDVDVTSVPTDPFGANADAASATGSISAKLRFIASTGIPITGTVTVGSHAVTNAGTFAVQAAQSGTWTVDLGATDNAVLDAIAASLAGTLTVASHAVTNAGTFAVQSTNQSGDNTIGRVKLTDGTDVADVLDLTNSNPLTVAIVDGTGDQITSFGGGTQYTEDAAAAANPVGTVPILVRADTPAGVVTTDGDNVAQRGTNFGAAYVQVVDSSGNFVNTFGGSGGTASADDADFTATTTQGTPAMGVYESSPSSVTDGDMGIVGITQTRALRCSVENTLTVASHAVTNAGTFAVQATVAAAATNIAKAEDAAHTTADVGVPALAVRRDSAAVGSDTDGDYSTLNVDSTGRLWCNVSNTVTVASHAVTNAGTFATQVDGAALTALQKIDDPVLVDDAAFTPATSSVMMSGFQADEASTDSIDEGDAGAARMTLDRKQIVTPQPHTTGGLSIFRSLDLDETEEDIKTSAGQLYGWYIFNASTSVRYVKFYNATAANVTVGTTTPVLTIPVPAATSGGVGMVFSVPGVHGILFDTAITAAATTGLADNDTGAPSANDVVIDALYK